MSQRASGEYSNGMNDERERMGNNMVRQRTAGCRDRDCRGAYCTPVKRLSPCLVQLKIELKFKSKSYF